MKKKYVLKGVAFVIIFVLLFSWVSKIMTAPADYRNYQWIAGFYEEPEESLDAVYIGSSSCYAFWNPTIAWNEYGIAVYPYSCNSQPFTAAMHIIKDLRKTQPNAVFLVNLNTLGDGDVSNADMHYLLDYMPFSMNKLDLTKHLLELNDITGEDQLEYYFPMVRYHSRWSELNPQDFDYSFNGFKGSSLYDAHMKTSIDITENYIWSDKKAELSDELLQYIDEFLDYCDEEQVKVVFVTVPRVQQVENLEKFHAVNDILESRGYPTLRLTDKYEEIGLDLTRDYYNETHTNVHGSIKFTRYISEYLIENYNFENKNGNEAYSSWDEAYKKYSEVIAPHVLDIEHTPEQRTDELEVPSDLMIAEEEEQIVVSWEPVEGADGYAVYKKTGANDQWEKATELTGTRYRDDNCESKIEYFYRVVPFIEKDGTKLYGEFSYLGVNLKKS